MRAGARFPTWGVLLVGVALAARALDLPGWWWWRQLVNAAYQRPDLAVSMLAEDRLAALPSSVQRTTKLPLSELTGTPAQHLLAALLGIAKRQLEWMPAHPIAFSNLARAALMQGRVGDAEVELGRALIRDPTSAQLHRLRGAVALARGDLDGGLEELAIAEAIAPGMHTPHIELIAEHRERVRLRGLELRGQFYPRRVVDNALALARALRAAGDLEASRQVLQGHLDRPEVQIETARWAVEDGNPSVAIEILGELVSDRAVATAVRSRAWATLATVRDFEGDEEGALDAAGRALELDPRSTYPYLALAELAERRGDWEDALEHLRRAWGMAPADVGLLQRLARAAELAGRPADALLALERAVEIDPDTPAIAAALVGLQMRQGRYAEAAITVAKALDRHPTDPTLIALTERLRREAGIR